MRSSYSLCSLRLSVLYRGWRHLNLDPISFPMTNNMKLFWWWNDLIKQIKFLIWVWWKTITKPGLVIMSGNVKNRQTSVSQAKLHVLSSHRFFSRLFWKISQLCQVQRFIQPNLITVSLQFWKILSNFLEFSRWVQNADLRSSST